jgi:hypothetical protein
MSYIGSGFLSDIALSLKQLLNAVVRPIWIDPTTGRPNINNITLVGTVTTVTGVTGVTTVTTVADVTRINNVGPAAGTQQSALYVQLYDISRQNWSLTVRARIT